jgi:hypothetical protein
MNICIPHHIGHQRVAGKRGIGEHRQMIVKRVVHMYSMVDTLLRRVEEANPFPTHRELKRIGQAGEILQTRGSKALLMPLQGWIVRRHTYEFVPVASDRDFTDISADVDRLIRVWAFAN